MKRYFALVENKVVRQVIVAKESPGNNWIETWRDGSGRGNYAGVGYRYDEDLDAFIPPKPHNSWVLNEETCLWEAPVPMPEDGKKYVWVDVLGNWFAKETE